MHFILISFDIIRKKHYTGRPNQILIRFHLFGWSVVVIGGNCAKYRQSDQSEAGTP